MRKPPSTFVTPAEFHTLASIGKTANVRRQLVATVQRAPEDGGLSFVMSTADVDRMSDVIQQDGWNVTDYEKNPVLLWAHDYGQPPVGKVGAVVLEEDKLKAKGVTFPAREVYEFGWTVGQLYEQGFMRAVSVGFSPDEWTMDEETGGCRFSKQTLLELSAVPVPANPNALLEAKAAGIDLRTVNAWASRWLDVHAKAAPVAEAATVARVYAATKAPKLSVTLRAPAEETPAEAPAEAPEEPMDGEAEAEDEAEDTMDAALVLAFAELSADMKTLAETNARLIEAVGALALALTQPEGAREDAPEPAKTADFTTLFHKHFSR